MAERAREPIIVFADGNCPMCVELASRLKKFDTHGVMRFVDANDPKWTAVAAGRFTPEEMLGQMATRMPNGTWRTGYFAWAEILRHMPSWSWLGWLMLCPVFYGIGPAVYAWVARRRRMISKALRLPPPCDENGVCRLNRIG
jgi:predicted DCC family thiol-disulfide oxidoreductase YuxK